MKPIFGPRRLHDGFRRRSTYPTRWEHEIRDNTDFRRHVDYIHYNPVKHRLVTRAADWPFSSFHRYVEQGILPADWAGDAKELFGRFGE